MKAAMITEIEFCLACPLPECIVDDHGCDRIRNDDSVIKKNGEFRLRKTNELKRIELVLEKYTGPISTRIIADEIGIDRRKIDLLKRQGFIKTEKVGNRLQVMEINYERGDA